MAFDLVLRGGTLVDGSGGPARTADVGVRGERITAVGDLSAVADGDVAAVIAPVKQRIAAIDANLPVLAVSSVANHMDLLLYDDRRNAWVGLAVAGLALTLGAVGVYGVVSLVTARRRKEIGIRVALGAERGQLLRLLLGKGVVLASAGAVLGIAGGLLAGRELRSQLHGNSPADPWSIALGTAVLVRVAVASSFRPAWRASRVDPATALRDE
jgi:ABC-type antimicrobial peptide transport system permease subunit